MSASLPSDAASSPAEVSPIHPIQSDRSPDEAAGDRHAASRSAKESVLDQPAPPYGMVIVHYRDAAGVQSLVNQSLTWTAPPSEIVIVDNSSDLVQSPDFAPAEECPVPLRIVDLPNPGYGAAANHGINLLSGRFEYLMVATQDLRAEADCAAELIAELQERPTAGAAVPLLAKASDPKRVFSAGGLLAGSGRSWHVGFDDAVSDWRSRPSKKTDWADGACLMLRSAAVKEIGGFDESFFLYVEDIDIGLRLRESGWQMWLTPRALASQAPGRYLLYLKYRNTIFFSRKHKELGRWPWGVLWPLDVLRSLPGDRRAATKWIFKGIRDGYRHRMGVPPEGAMASAVVQGRHASEDWLRAKLPGGKSH